VTGGQVHQLCDVVQALKLPRVTIETNGIGGFSPAVLKGALKQRRLVCGVATQHSTVQKNKRILEAWEPLLMAEGQLWAHTSVLDGPLVVQMRDWNPAVADQPDDHLDGLAGSIEETPERIGKDVDASGGGWIAPDQAGHDWRPSAGEHEVQLEY
jgi:hypothetical protein